MGLPSARRERVGLSVVASGLRVEGDLNSDEDIAIAGYVRGDIWARSVIIAHGGSVDGAIEADTVRVAGDLRGPVHAGRITIDASGRVAGGLTALQTIDIGGAVRGDCIAEWIGVRHGGRLEGQAEAREAELAGELHGRSFTLDVTIRSTARIFGRVVHHKETIEPGAFVDGMRPWRPRPQMEQEWQARWATVLQQQKSA